MVVDACCQNQLANSIELAISQTAYKIISNSVSLIKTRRQMESASTYKIPWSHCYGL